MPELPEVELVCRSLSRVLQGRTIVKSRITLPRLVRPASPRAVAGRLRNVALGPIRRRAKYILIPAGESDVLIAHLGMTGRFLYLDLDDKLPTHSHAVFYLDNEMRLAFCDPRQFGHLGVSERDKLDNYSLLKGLGPEPLSTDFTIEYLHDALGSTRRTLKETLLDQRKVAGLGNIYAAEAMFQAGISPFIVADRIGQNRVERLYVAIQDVLTESIGHGSTIELDPNQIDEAYFSGRGGHFLVYDREGKPCSNCGTAIKRVYLGGRSTYFCPRCQRR